MPSTVKRISFGTRNELRARLVRQLCCAAKPRSIIQTFGRVVVYGDAVDVSAHLVGMVDGSLRNIDQSGMGTAEPMHPICCTPPGKPVASIAGATIVDATSLRKSPM